MRQDDRRLCHRLYSLLIGPYFQLSYILITLCSFIYSCFNNIVRFNECQFKPCFHEDAEDCLHTRSHSYNRKEFSSWHRGT